MTDLLQLIVYYSSRQLFPDFFSYVSFCHEWDSLVWCTPVGRPERPHSSLGHRKVCWNWNSEPSLIILGKFESSMKKYNLKSQIKYFIKITSLMKYFYSCLTFVSTQVDDHVGTRGYWLNCQTWNFLCCSIQNTNIILSIYLSISLSLSLSLYIYIYIYIYGVSVVKNQPAMQETWVQSLAWEDPWRWKCQPTPRFLPGKSHGQRSLVGYSPWSYKSPTRLSDSTTTAKIEYAEDLKSWDRGLGTCESLEECPLSKPIRESRLGRGMEVRDQGHGLR